MHAPTSHSYCTYFDSGYLARGLTLIDSLQAHGDDAPVWILCLDDDAKAYLDDLGDDRLHTLVAADLEDAESGLSEARAGRSRMEYYFTCTPQLVRYVMRAEAQPDAVVIYLDADMYFFADPSLALTALGGGSVGIIEHRYPKRLEARLGKYGRYNVGWVGFRADDNGRACLDWWAASCLEWCFDIPEDGKYADQGYLDAFAARFDGVVSLQGGGLDLAPWNTGRHDLSVQSTSTGDRVIVDRHDPLVFFHFHGLKQAGSWFVTSQLVYGSRLRGILRDRIYIPYLARLKHFTELAAASGHGAAPVTSKRGNGVRGVLFRLQRTLLDRVSIATGNAVRRTDLRA